MKLEHLLITTLNLTLALTLTACERQAPGSRHNEITSPLQPHTLNQSTPPTPETKLPPPLALAQKSGCLNCHAVDHKVIGPPWLDVSKRYADDTEARGRLIKKVHTGGGGNWTEVTGGVIMPAYGGRVADKDIETLVDFVLSLAQSPQ